jgi:hypothetical protein
VCTSANCGIYRSVRAALCGRLCVVAFGATGRASRASDAGITWSCRTPKAEWAARFGHTTVIDAAGAIYVIGGQGDTGNFQDVWASADGGARAGLGQGGWSSGGTRGVLNGYHRGTLGVPQG